MTIKGHVPDHAKILRRWAEYRLYQYGNHGSGG